MSGYYQAWLLLLFLYYEVNESMSFVQEAPRYSDMERNYNLKLYMLALNYVGCVEDLTPRQASGRFYMTRYISRTQTRSAILYVGSRNASEQANVVMHPLERYF